METTVPQDLRTATVRLATSLPAGSPARHALLQVLASSRTAAKTGEKELGSLHPELKRAIEGLSKKAQALDDEMDKVLQLVKTISTKQGDEDGDEAAGAAERLLRDLQKLKKQVSAANDEDGALGFYKRAL